MMKKEGELLKRTRTISRTTVIREAEGEDRDDEETLEMERA